jgi:multicomponent Na+:H+ antiporter subunit D
MAWLVDEPSGGKEHGEAPPLVVFALCLTALMTLGFFFFNGPVIELEQQLVKGMLP